MQWDRPTHYQDDPEEIRKIQEYKRKNPEVPAKDLGRLFNRSKSFICRALKVEV